MLESKHTKFFLIAPFIWFNELDLFPHHELSATKRNFMNLLFIVNCAF